MQLLNAAPISASAPYKAVAAAPFNTVMLSMLSVLISVEDILIPSTTYNTSCSPSKSTAALGSKVELVPEITCTPATLPANAVLKSSCCALVKADPSTFCCA